jgi:hypothetical protein
MSYNIADIFGTCITGYAKTVDIDRQYAGLPGANGILSMHLGTRGRQIVVTGRLYTAGNTYALARAAMVIAIGAIEVWLFPGVPPVDLTYFNEIYYNCVMDEFRLIPDGRGKLYHIVAGGVAVDFISFWREQM